MKSITAREAANTTRRRKAAGFPVIKTLDEFDFAFQPDDVLLFGKESAGAPDYVHAAADARVVIPLRADARSLNLSVTAGIALWEGLRQTGAFPAGGQLRINRAD